ncbi:hypothetical protein CRG98_031366 [Punica granatum]|uniref:Uncharacterized protein n=1 Tax=Punica granatum TaxID=22663 RepID=A0A2I0IWV6_PUNGR|nr:hypothetical protein CRG98_031366 [Punica granatum]
MEWIKLISYIMYLDENLDDLKWKRDGLISILQDISRKVKLEERRYKRQAGEVVDWLKRVEVITEEVDGILEEGRSQSVREIVSSIYLNVTLTFQTRQKNPVNVEINLALRYVGNLTTTFLFGHKEKETAKLHHPVIEGHVFDQLSITSEQELEMK